MPKRPRSPFFKPYQPPMGLSLARAQASTGAVLRRLLFVALPQWYPITSVLQHGVQDLVEQRPVVAPLGIADLHHQAQVGLSNSSR